LASVDLNIQLLTRSGCLVTDSQWLEGVVPQRSLSLDTSVVCYRLNSSGDATSEVTLLRQGISDLMMGCPAALNLARFFVQRSKLQKATRLYQPLARLSAIHGVN